MTGPEHYLAAEEILSRLTLRDPRASSDLASLAIAQIHATLAHAAATALGDHAWRAWFEVAGSNLLPPEA